MKRMVLFAGIAALTVSCLGPSANAADDCTPQVGIVYYGATAVNTSINEAAKNLYGTPVSDCGNNVRTYRAMRDLNGDGTKDTCVAFYIGANLGSCEGVEAMDRKLNNFNVCPVTGGAPIQVGNILDETGSPLYATLVGSDVRYTLCEPVLTNPLNRPDIFENTEDKAFVIPFSFIINRDIRTALPARKVVAPPVACPSGYADCPRVDFSLTVDQLRGLYGNNSICDIRQLDQNINPSTNRAIGTVMRQKLSGTRRNFDVTVLSSQGMGEGSLFLAGTGDVISAVNKNNWCGDGMSGSKCGNNGTGGNPSNSPCTGFAPTAVSLGPIGTDRLVIVDPGTPADPFDDYPVRGRATDLYDAVAWNGEHFNKAKVRCGQYEYWSYEKLYFDNEYHTPGSVRETAVLELINQTKIDAKVDATVVSLDQMFFSRARDGAALFPNQPYNAFCYQP